MSLCALSWRNIQRYNAQHNTRYVQMSTYSNGDYVAVDAQGFSWYIDRKTGETAPGMPTTTAAAVRDGLTGDDEWTIELRRRVELLA